MKTKFILGFLFGILLVGMASASITGYVTRGSGVYDSGYTATLQKVDSNGVATISVQTPDGNTEFVRVAEGETAKVDGVEISASSLTRGTLFRRAGANVEINVKPISTKIVASTTEENCNNLCTETYNLDEGEVKTIQGNQISIDFIDADSAQLEVNGQITSDIPENSKFELSNGQLVTVKNVHFLGVPGAPGWVELCVNGCYNVNEGEVKTIQGNQISIDFIDADSAQLEVNGQITSDIPENSKFELSNGQLVTVKNVHFLGVPGAPGWVELCLPSSY